MALLINVLSIGDSNTRADVEEFKNIYRGHNDNSSLAMRDVATNTELKQVTLVYKKTASSLSFAQKSTREECKRTSALLGLPT